MTLEVPVKEFLEKWELIKSNSNEEIYSCGTLKGTIKYEDDAYFIIDLKN